MPIDPFSLFALGTGAYETLKRIFGGGPKNRTIYEQGHPMWPGSEPVNPYPWAGLPTGGGGGGSSSSSKSATNSTQTTDMSTMPFFTPQMQGFGNLLQGQIMARLAQGSGLPKGYEATGIQGVNSTYEAGQQALRNKLAGAGLLGSPVEGGGLAQLQSARLSDIAGFRNQLPLLSRELQNEDWGIAGNFLNTFGKGTQQKGTVKTASTTNTQSQGSGGGGGGPVSPYAGAPPGYFERPPANEGGGGSWWEDVAAYLMYLKGQGLIGGSPKSKGGPVSSPYPPPGSGGTVWG